MLTYDKQSGNQLLETSGSPATRLRPLLKWPGNKEHELPHLLPLIPPFQRYFDPFVGGGAAFFALQGKERYINDRSSKLIALYQKIAEGDKCFFNFLDLLIQCWMHISHFADTNAEELIGLYKSLSTRLT